MSSYFRLTVLNGRSAPSIKAWLRVQTGYRPSSIERVASLFSDVAGGVHSGYLSLATTAVQATGTITLSSFVATNTITVAGVTFTGVASGATGNQFNIGASDTATAANAVAAINASTTSGLNSMVIASSSGAVITITSLVPGYIGNMITLAISAHGSVSGANLTGGSEDAAINMYNGILPNGGSVSI
jgi:hypothetical protein